MKSNSKILVAYFGVPETNNPNNMTQDQANSVHVVNGEVFGNTHYIAKLIQEKTGATLYQIETIKDYPLDHATLVGQAKEELMSNARPKLKNQIDSIDNYDVIFIGYPNWWADLPMPIYTFLEQYDFSGKTIIPFATHGGSGLSNTVRTIKNKLISATIEKNAFVISRDNMDSSQELVNSWLNELGYK